MQNLKTRFLNAAVCAFALGCAPPSHATNLVGNGGFELTSFDLATTHKGQMGFNNTATGWATNGYNFLFNPGSADTTGVTGQYGNLFLWGTNNGGVSTLPSSSPTGGNYVAADGAFNVAPITQTITGLTPGTSYDLSFWWAAAQQEGFTGATTDKWQVSLGAQTFSTSIHSLPNHAFSGWMKQTFTYTATSTSSVLSFLAVGTPDGLPPFALLDGVDLEISAVPEPSTCLAGGLLMGGALLRRYRRKAQA